jgi:hypothetical protein
MSVTHQDPFAPARVVHRGAQGAASAPARVPAPPDPVVAEAPAQAATQAGEGEVPMAAAADILGLAKRDVQRACREGTLPCRKAPNGRWFVDIPAARAALARG